MNFEASFYYFFGCASVKNWEISTCFASAPRYERNLKKNGRFWLKNWQIPNFLSLWCTNVVGQNQDQVISVVCTTHVIIVNFRNFFDAKLWKIICIIRFSTFFWLPEKIDGIVAVFLKKKKSENPRLTIFKFFLC